MIYSLQSYRGLAVLSVLLYHCYMALIGYVQPTQFTAMFSFGHAGVDFFFVLSGFIIFKIHRADIGMPNRLFLYLKKRLIRIYPLYWLLTLVFLPFWLFIPSFGEPYHREFWGIITSLLLFPQVHGPHIQVAWTLVHEVFFYICFALLILNRRAGIVFFVAWSLTLVFCWLMDLRLIFPFSFLLNKVNLLFLFGLLAAILSLRLTNVIEGRQGVFLFVLGNLCFFSCAAFDTPDYRGERLTLLYGVAAALIVASSVNPRVNDFWSKQKTTLFLGDASYSIYLIHPMILSFVVKVFSILQVESYLNVNIIFLLLLLSGLLGGSLCYIFVEKPLLNALRIRFLQK